MIVIFLIIIFLIIIIILAWIRNNIKNNEGNTAVYKYQNIKKYLKTGDIILFSCNKHNNKFDGITYYCRTMLLGSEYGHGGIVIRDGDKLFVLECTDIGHICEKDAVYLNNYNRGGIRIIDMDILLKEYHNMYQGHYGVRFITEEIPNTDLIKYLSDYKNVIFENKKILFLLALSDIFISHDTARYLTKFSSKDRMMCTEFVHSILYKCGVFKYYPSKLFWPHIINDEQFKQLEKIKYSNIFKFVYNE